MKSWKKRWKDELNETVPKLDDKVKNAPIPVSECELQSDGSVALSSRRNAALVFAAVAVAVVLAVGGLLLFLPGKDVHDVLFTLEINPTVTFSADKNGSVTGVLSSNTDADLLFAKSSVKSGVIGKSAADAVTYLTDVAAQLGFINFDNAKSAVRISAAGDNGRLLSEAKKSLTEYFLQKGALVAVVAEEVDKQEFCARSGLSSELSFDGLNKTVRESQTVFSLRQANGKNSNDLKKLYEENVAQNNFFEYFRVNLTDHIDRIEQNVADVARLVELQAQIYSHKDNPMTVLKDYWSVLEFGKGDYSEEFASLMSEMGELLSDYKKDYGSEITSIFDLSRIEDNYAKLSLDAIRELLNDFTKEKFGKYFDVLTAVLQSAGLVSEEFSELFCAPETLEEFIGKTEKVLENSFESRIAEFSLDYGKDRAPKTFSEYEAFVADIESVYGSLTEYYNAVKN